MLSLIGAILWLIAVIIIVYGMGVAIWPGRLSLRMYRITAALLVVGALCAFSGTVLVSL